LRHEVAAAQLRKDNRTNVGTFLWLAVSNRRLFRGMLFAVVPRAKAELSKHCPAITLTPEGSTFRIAGDCNLLGGRSDGAGARLAPCNHGSITPQITFRIEVAV
jgi:hypothetical protein